MYSIWLKVKPHSQTPYAHYADGSGPEICEIAVKLKESFTTDSIAITPIGRQPIENSTLPDCPVQACAKCPHAVKNECGLYKLYRNNAKVYPKTADKVLTYEESNELKDTNKRRTG